MLENGEVPIYEPGLDLYVHRNAESGRLTFTTDVDKAIRDSDVIFIAVGTPMDEDGSADLQHVLAVAQRIAKNIDTYKVVVLKSTVPVGTAEKVEKLIKSESDVPFDVISNPEFLKEGAALEDFLRPDRVVVGFKSEKGRKIMEHLYSPLVRQGNPILFMDNRSAELTKYAANSFLATKVSFINDMALLADKIGADIRAVRKGMITDQRIGNKFLYPGCGYGGACFPKDVQALVKIAKDYDHRLQICEAVEQVNKNQKQVLFQKVKDYFKDNLAGRTIAIWGLSFKPQTDDMREAPSIELINSLVSSGVTVRAYDPAAQETAKMIFQDKIGKSIYLEKDAYSALKNADAMVLVTEWNEFRTVDFKKMKTTMKTPVIFDGRNIFSPEQSQDLGFTYFGIGTGGDKNKGKTT